MSKFETQTMTMQERLDCPFKMFGTTVQIKLVDIDALAKMVMEKRKKEGLSMKITFVPARTKKYHDPIFRPTFVKDAITGIYYGITIGEHPDGNPKWQKIPLEEGFELDLTKDHELKWWCILRMHPEVNVSPFAMDEPRFIVIDPEVEATKDIAKAQLMSTVLSKVRVMEKGKIRNFARWCDIMLIGDESPNVIRAKLLNFALSSPDLLQVKLEDANRNVGEVFRSAEVLGIVGHSNEKGYQYKTVFLGLTTLEALEYLGQNTDTLKAISSEVEKMDAQLTAATSDNDD